MYLKFDVKIFICLIFLLSGCKGETLNKDVRSAAEDAIRMADNFLNEDIAAGSAAYKIDLLTENLPQIDTSKIGDLAADISTEIVKLSVALDSIPESGKDENGSVLSARNSLAKLIGLKARSDDEVNTSENDGGANMTVGETKRESTS